MNRRSHPPIFQGKLTDTSYFEGWYIKCLSDDLTSSIAFIPGISLSEDRHAFLQVNTSDGLTEYISFPLETFRFSETAFDISIGDNQFSETGIRLNIERPGISLHGTLQFYDMQYFPSKPLAPGIMGWFSFVSFMECYHGVVSMRHAIEGEITFNGHHYDIKKGVGYIEKDWGRSFPEAWVWMQANPFQGSDASFMLSVAKIPFMGMKFTGLIGFLYYNGKLERFATYLGHRLISLRYHEGELHIELKNGAHRLRVMAQQGEGGHLTAPVQGNMNRSMKESLNSMLHIELLDKKGNVLFSDSSHIAGLEISDAEKIMK